MGEKGRMVKREKDLVVPTVSHTLVGEKAVGRVVTAKEAEEKVAE